MQNTQLYCYFLHGALTSLEWANMQRIKGTIVPEKWSHFMYSSMLQLTGYISCESSHKVITEQSLAERCSSLSPLLTGGGGNCVFVRSAFHSQWGHFNHFIYPGEIYCGFMNSLPWYFTVNGSRQAILMLWGGWLEKEHGLIPNPEGHWWKGNLVLALVSNSGLDYKKDKWGKYPKTSTTG